MSRRVRSVVRDGSWGNPGTACLGLRRLGADVASGEIIAFVEDACVVEPGWADAIRTSFSNGACHATTGPVMQGDAASRTDWAVYFVEYAPFAKGAGQFDAGVPGSQPIRLAGINFACRREALLPSRTIREAELSIRLAGSIRWVEAAAVRHVRHYAFSEAIADRWRFGQTYGRERWSDRPGPLRRLGLAAAPAILSVQLARLAACVVRRPRLIGPAVLAMPRTVVLLTAWSLAEALGWADSGWRRHERAARRLASAAGRSTTEPAGCKPTPVLASPGTYLPDPQA